MNEVKTTEPDYRSIQLLLDAGKVTDALSLSAKLVQSDPSNCQLQLYYLLTRVIAHGPEPCEAEIADLCSRPELTENERVIATQLLRYGFELATSKGDAGKAWAYQRALRRFVAGLPLDRPLASLHLQEVSQAKAITGSLATVASANLRAIFSEEAEDERTRTGFGMQQFNEKLKMSVRRFSRMASVGLGSLQVFAAKLPRLLLKVSGGISIATRDSRIVFAARTPMAIPRRVGKIVGGSLGLLVAIGAIFLTLNFLATARAPALIATNPQPPAEALLRPSPVSLSMPEVEREETVPVASTSAPDTARASLNRPGTQVIDAPTQSRSSTPGRQEAVQRELPKTSPQVYNATQIIGLRQQPNYGAPKGDPIETGARLIKLEQYGSWVKVRDEASGASGYVRTEFIAPVTSIPENLAQ